MKKIALNTKIEHAIFTTKDRIALLYDLGIFTAQNLLEYYPRAYEKTNEVKNIYEIRGDQKNVLSGFFSSIQEERTRGGMLLTKAIFIDTSENAIECVWFNQPHIKRILPLNKQLKISAKSKISYGKITFQNPTFEEISDEMIHLAGIVPIYREHDKLSAEWFRKKIYELLEVTEKFSDILPSEIIVKEDLLNRDSAISELHFPTSTEKLKNAKRTIAFEELFVLQLAGLLRKKKWQEQTEGKSKKIPLDADLQKKFFDSLPFELTGGQKVALFEVLKDFEKDTPMLRLMEGDVGSGKTVVAVAASLPIIRENLQVAFLAPTEVLANQHYQSISELYKKFEQKKESPLPNPLPEGEGNKEEENIKSPLPNPLPEGEGNKEEENIKSSFAEGEGNKEKDISAFNKNTLNSLFQGERVNKEEDISAFKENSLNPLSQGERAGERGQISPKILEYARRLRKNQTDAEGKLWYILRNKNFLGLKFKRQQPIDNFIVDFLCYEKSLIIELDGGQHLEPNHYKKDQERDEILQKKGFRVVRILDNEIFENFDGVLDQIYLECFEKSPLPNPLPEGEGNKEEENKEEDISFQEKSKNSLFFCGGVESNNVEKVSNSSFTSAENRKKIKLPLPNPLPEGEGNKEEEKIKSSFAEGEGNKEEKIFSEEKPKNSISYFASIKNEGKVILKNDKNNSLSQGERVNKEDGISAFKENSLSSLSQGERAGERGQNEEQKIKTELLTGAIKGKKRDQILEDLRKGKIDVLIGTHALIQESVIWHNLGFVVIDEQHRFGVKQREVLLRQGAPHILQMTATPIPRTLAIVAFGDQDLSVISELPKGRKPIHTKVVSPSGRKQIELFIEQEISKGRQGFVICPLVAGSDKIIAKAATDEFQRLKKYIFPKLRLGLLHGRMKSSEKKEIMEKFKAKEFDLLVSTAVVEVGVDVPNATMMIIEGAERFGLAQLHQFRGRVGRGEYQSYCFLFTSEDIGATQRLRALEKYHDGFKLAEIDLHLRGPGEVFGVMQSGIPDLKMASLFDARVISSARKEAEEYVKKYDFEDFSENLKKEIIKKESEGVERV